MSKTKNTKKTLSAVLAATIVATGVTPVFAATTAEQAATEAVKAAKTDSTKIAEAVTVVNALQTGAAKTALVKALAPIRANYEKLVTEATIASKTDFTKIKYAYELIMGLPAGNAKNALVQAYNVKVRAIAEAEARKLVLAAKAAKTQEAIDAAKAAIENLVDGNFKTTITGIADAIVVGPGLKVSSATVITSKTVSVVLADGQDDVVAADKASYTVKVGETVVPVTAVAYVKEAKKATLTVDLTGKQGTVTVNAVAIKDAVDYKAAEVLTVTPANLTTLYVDFTEKVDKASAELTTNYGVVLKGTATIGRVSGATLISDTRVRLTVDALKDASNYTLTVAGVKDASSALNVMDSVSKDFTAVKDSVKPQLVSATPVDGNPSATLTLKFSEEVTGAGTYKLEKYDKDNKLVSVVASTPVAVLNKDSVDLSLARLEDGVKYVVTVSGLKDLADNTMDEQKIEFTGVKDTVAPSVTGSTSVDGKLTVTFSEKLAAGTTFAVRDALTGDLVTATVDSTNKDADKLVLNLGSDVKVGKNYVLRLTNVKDLAGNAMAAQNVTFAGTQAVAKVTVSSAVSTVQAALADKDGKALAALAENTVVVTLNTSVSKVEAENIANYTVYQKADDKKTLAVTKAVYDDSKLTVTLTTADQVAGTAYTVKVSGLTNLSTTGVTADFTGVDYKAPVFKSVAQTSSLGLKVTFDEKVTTTNAKATLVSNDYADAITVSSYAVDADGNLLLTLGKALDGSKTYILRLEGIQDAQGNYRVAGSTSAVVTSTQIAKDTVAPKLVSSVAVNARIVELTFDEDLGAALPNVAVKDDKGATVTGVVVSVSGKKVVLTTTVDTFLTGKVYSAEVYGVQDLVGNNVEAANKLTAVFAGNKDEVSPKLVSASSSIVKGSDYKVADAVVAGTTAGTNYTKVTLTFDEKVKLATANTIAATIIAPDFTTKVVLPNSAKVGEDGKTVEFLLLAPTAAGDKFIIKVDEASVTDIAATPNKLDAAANYTNFTTVDTTVPTISTFKFADKDGKNEVAAAIDSAAGTIVLDVADATAYSTGSVAISEDVKVSLDATGTAYDVPAISVSKDLDTASLVKLVLGLSGKDSVTGAQISSVLNKSKVTLEDAVGNKTVYTITVQ